MRIFILVLVVLPSEITFHVSGHHGECEEVVVWEVQ